MQMTRVWSALAAALLVATVAPATAADEAADLSAKIDQAISAAASYRVTVAGPGVALDIVTVGRDRMRLQSTTGGATQESVVIGSAMYVHSAAAPWAASAVSVVKRRRKNLLYMGAPDTKLEPLADRSEAGVTYGAFGSLAIGNAGVPGTMECTYDKTTFRPRTCLVLLQSVPVPVRVTYDKWNDPSNTVEAPPGVAPPTPSPAPAPSPSMRP